jgi:hypothetical protein
LGFEKIHIRAHKRLRKRVWSMREGEGVGEAHGEGRELTHVKNKRVNAWGNKIGIQRMFKR